VSLDRAAHILGAIASYAAVAEDSVVTDMYTKLHGMLEKNLEALKPHMMDAAMPTAATSRRRRRDEGSDDDSDDSSSEEEGDEEDDSEQDESSSDDGDEAMAGGSGGSKKRKQQRRSGGGAGASASSSSRATLTAEERSQLSKVGALLGLASALVPHLSDDALRSLYQVAKPLLWGKRLGVLQKRAYQVVQGLLRHHDAEKFAADESELAHLALALSNSLSGVGPGSKRARLHCIALLIPTLVLADAGQVDVVTALLGEVIMCTKEPSGKVRYAAYEVLVALASASLVAFPPPPVDDDGFEEEGVDPDAEYPEHAFTMTKYLHTVVAGLAGASTHLQSAALQTLARLVYALGPSSVAVRRTVPQLMDAVLALAQAPVKEVVRAAVAFVKVSTVVLPKSSLEESLGPIIGSLLSSPFKRSLRTPIRYIMERLLRKLGYVHSMFHALAPSARPCDSCVCEIRVMVCIVSRCVPRDAL
jgi:hypothetical protein